ncbi:MULTISPECIES: type II toxin-antitoxin system RelE/ParE family toxin [unclassified Facklamia]|uniref:type II toxin-antitoxin system RelE/ParE family toxin n=1 Tax=Aerococcaceae TaxID=186827 RepID=UPI0013B816C8|nr:MULTISPECIES: type II toxin-antitoxin system RelE/ParE family toxin [unclassified Facklamia]NEW64155.1 type II toxin-antitoxin system mRNA interferase toxin, RelE/StbE family [Facklamia sp. 252]NEW67612.1 type II toxin-antitoxin system mRNA interferase toxin, RelE/StbE family [Facklamia sp. 253]QQD65860.1 type II toxin-antitoxin system RelE/ParE family toxin [Aerococcaceae bacterium zg-252]
MEYKLIYHDSVLRTLEEIYYYILNNFQSEQSAKNKIADLYSNLEVLKTFPEAGFCADEKFGKVIDKRYITRGIALGREYIALYFIDKENMTVVITHLLPTRTDYLQIFR